MKPLVVILAVILSTSLFVRGDEDPAASEQHVLIQVLAKELAHSMENLTTEDGKQPYYLARVAPVLRRN